MKKILFTFVIIGITISTMIYSCKKEPKEDSSQKNMASSASMGDPTYYSEDEIGAFIKDVVYYKTHSNESRWIEINEAINIMEQATNYQYSDIDTPFADFDTTFTYSFSLTASDDGKYNMPNIATKMYEIKSFILDKLSINFGETYSTRVHASSIDASEDAYIFTLYIGKAYNTIPDDMLTAPNPPTVSNAYYHWGWGPSTYFNGCTLSAVYEIQKKGAQYMRDIQNYNIATANSVYTVPTGYATMYATGVNTIPKTTSLPLPNYFKYNDISSSIATSFPTTLPVSIGDLTPVTSAIFAGTIGNDVTVTLDVHLQPVGYDWCMPASYINYYISKVNDVFDVLKPSAYAVPFYYHPEYTNPDNRLYSGFAVDPANTGYITSSGLLYHQYQYRYLTVVYKNRNLYYY